MRNLKGCRAEPGTPTCLWLSLGSSAPAAGKLNEATSPGLALQLNGPKTSWCDINQTLSEIKKKNKKNRKPAQEEDIRGSQTGQGSVQLQAGRLSARSPLPSSFGKVERFHHSSNLPSHSFLHLRTKAGPVYISSQPAQLCSALA